jgi:hypothetical protein
MIWGVLLVLVIFVGVLLAALYLPKQKPPPAPTPTPAESPTTTSSQEMPKENLYGVNAKIVEINNQESTIKVKSYIPSDWNKEWILVISDSTMLATDRSWQEAQKARFMVSSGEDLTPEKQAEREEKSRQLLKVLTLEDFKIGDIVYVTAENDFAKNSKIVNVDTVRLLNE